MRGSVEGFSRTTIKDTWTKPRGVEVRRGMAAMEGKKWAVNADNCI